MEYCVYIKMATIYFVLTRTALAGDNTSYIYAVLVLPAFACVQTMV